MTDKSEEQIAKEKASVEAMKNAKANMDAALSRIATLEQAVEHALTGIKAAKQYIPNNVYVYAGSNQQQQSVHARIDYWADLARKALG